MWVVSGPFDGDEGQESSTEKSKLLKPGKRYALGRKDADLLISSKKISREHVTFTLSDFPTSRVDDPTFKPKARLHNPRNKHITIQRGINLITLDPSSSTELWDGDAIHLVGGITVVISWYQLCCRSPATVVVDKESCAKIGIHVVHSSYPEVTHSIVQELTLTPSCVLSLLKSKVVTPKWLTDVIRRGTEDSPSSVLEQHFELPDTSSYLPTVSAALPSTLSSTDVWVAGATRRGILDEHRFIIFTCNSENVEDFQSVISTSGGGYELFPVDSGRMRLHRRLSAGKDKRKVIVVDDEVKASVTPDAWNELIDEAKSFEVTFCSREQVIETVVVGEPSALRDSSARRVVEFSSQSRHGDSLQEHVEGSLRPKRLTRRTTPSAHPSLDRERPSEVESPQVRRVLTRRIKGGSVPPTADDSGTLDGSHSVREDSTPPIGIDMNIPLLPRPSRPLKRRAGTAMPESVLQSTDELGTPDVEPPLKKFKALFEESDPDRLVLSLPHDSLDVMHQSYPQPSPIPTDGSPGQGDETSQSRAIVKSRGTKRRAGIEDAEDGPVSSASAERENFARPLKRRAVDKAPRSNTEAHSHDSQPSMSCGANFGEPDTDNHLLTALASMKKGKKNEDSFDREFNNLRISKPDIEREVKEQEWDLLDGLDDEHDVRGNFMLVMELDIYKKGESAGKGTLRTGRIDWEGKPDFKKFRRKNDPRRRPVVELVMNQGNDYGVGPAYWKDDPDLANADEFLGHSQASSKARTLQLPIEDSDDEDQFTVKPPTKASTRTTKGKNQGSRQKKASEPLFLSSEDEEAAEVSKHGEGDDRDEGTETLRSAGSSRKSRVQQGQAKRMVVVVDDDDSDDGTTFKGFGTKPKSGRRR